MNNPIYKIFVLDIFGEKFMEYNHELAGWYYKLDSAMLAVKNNSCDIQDSAYNHAVIVKSFEGLYDLDSEELQWFKWDSVNRMWFEIDYRPQALQQTQLS